MWRRINILVLDVWFPLSLRRVSLYLFYLEVDFISYKYSYSYTRFSLDATCLDYQFLPFCLESLSILVAEMCLPKAANGWVLFFSSYLLLCAFWLVSSCHLNLGWLLIYEGLVLTFYVLFSDYSVSILYLSPIFRSSILVWLFL